MDEFRETLAGLDAIAASMNEKDERIKSQAVKLAELRSIIRQNNNDYYTAKLIIQDLKEEINTLRASNFELEKELKCRIKGRPSTLTRLLKTWSRRFVTTSA